MAYDFSLDRKAAITLSAGSVILLLLFFALGVLTGMNWQSERGTMATNRPPASETKAQGSPSANAATRDPGASGGNEPPPTAPPATAAAAAPPPSPAAPIDSKAPAAAATDDVPPRLATPVGVQLAIQVGSFLEKANAEKLAERLKEEGYAPQIVLGGHAPKQWNIVRVGPYRDWDEASEIAAVLSRDQEAPAVVRPMR
jgi:cell division protein FtsN